MTRTLTLLALLAPTGLFACDADRDDPGAGGQFGEEDYGCLPQSEAPVDLDEVLPNGLTAQDLIDAASGSHQADLVWEGGATTGMTVGLSAPGNARWIDYEFESDGRDSVPDLACLDTVAVDFAVAVSTDDGALALTGTHTVELADAVMEIATWISLDDNTGTLDVASFSEQSFDEVWADLEVVFAEAGIRGQVYGYGEKTEGSGPDGTVSLTIFDVASFGGDAE